MVERPLQRRLQTVATWAYRAAAVALLVCAAAAVLFRWDRSVHTMDDARARVLLTAGAALAIAWLATLFARTMRVFRRSSGVGLVALAVQMAAFGLLVWTSGKTSPTPWRIWWVGLVASATAAHVVVLRVLAERRGSKLTRTTIASAVATAILLVWLAVRRDLLGDVPAWYPWVLGAAASVSSVGSMVVYARYRRRYPRQMNKWVRRGWVIGGQVAILVVGFYVGRVTAPVPGVVDLMPSMLGQLSQAQLDRQIAEDLARLKAIAAGVDDLAAKVDVLHAELSAKRKAEHRAYYLPEEEDRVKSAFMSYLAYRAALLRTAATYANFRAVSDPEQRDRCFLVGYTAGATVMQESVALVTGCGGDDVVRRKLNEGDPAWGLRPGMFDEVYASVTAPRNVDTFAEMAAYFDERREAWDRDGLLPRDDLAWLEKRIARAREQVAAAPLDLGAARLGQWVSRVKADWYSPVYATQSMVSTWIGDTKVADREPCIRLGQIDDVATKLRPGDILLERRNWFFSNAFLPGFWPHAVLYVGTMKDLEQLGLIKKDARGGWTSDIPAVRDRIARYAVLAEDGTEHRVIESVSDGVIFNSLHHSLHADYVAALRPRLSDGQKAEAIAKAFGHEGKPYDFEFDFFSSDKLVCTELVYRAYEGMLHFPLVRVMGRDTLPALEIARKFGRERGEKSRQLEFVFFLDTPPGQSRAVLADEQTFVDSADRPRGFNE